ncbi:glyoxalase family protein [Deinococcus reticulitermitis]|uniref:Glyoxalase family protein n=1 Tax=Deinococcus reticulitermitis TaxID=856736 RepID=A0A1H6ZD20_9DEIO|nr:ring-cleaving dioxygenase [Deinococcus reticulitermitis]SEJ51238.1 glyoxalase family protein [Deinococcus reticulitermitis]
MPPTLSGLHHVSALTADLSRNHDFYTRVLGLRLVKRTVNQDSPGMSHLFYADALGTPGTETTFFDFPRAAREHRGQGAVSLTTFRVTGEEALTFWAGRLTGLGVPHELTRRDGRPHLPFEDPDGTRLALFDDGGEGPRGGPWAGTDVPAAFQLQGLGYSGSAVGDLTPTRDLLERGLGLREVRTYDLEGHPTHVFALGSGGPHAELHLSVRPDLPRARPGAGGVHHVALRVRDEAELSAWARHLTAEGFSHSGEVDRHWFRSVYVRDPGGLVFELATDRPGLTADEPLETLGQTLSLPPRFEPRRATIEAHLPPLTTQETP